MAIEAQAINVTMETTCFVFSVTLVISMLITKAHKTKLARIFLWMVVTNSVVLLCDALAWGFAGWPDARIAPFLMVINFFVYILSYAQFAVTAYYIITYLTVRKARVRKWIVPTFIITFSVAVGLVVFAQFTDAVYYIDESNIFQFGPLYSILYYLTFSMAVLFSALVVAYRKYIARRELGALMFYMLSIVAALLVEIFLPDIMFVNAMTSVSLVVLFVLVHFQQEVDYAEMESDYKTSIMLSQIQPHFLSNTLGTIAYLCDKEGAEQSSAAVHQFAGYLQGNMDSLTYTAPIPFAKELEHTQHYLSLEKQKFEGKLSVELDIQTTDFCLPALTLQPIVENAVRHGICRLDEGGTVTIRATEDITHWRVAVTDNGAGFDVRSQLQDGESHIGINNVRHRLKKMSGGTLTINSEPGVGTEAIISIPKEMET